MATIQSPPAPGPSSLPSMPSQSTTQQPDSDHTELYYTDLEEAGQTGSEGSSSESEEETRVYTLRKSDLRFVKPSPGDRKGKGVAFTDMEPNGHVPLDPYDRPVPPKERQTDKRSWSDLDLSLVVALVSPIGNWLTGGDHVKNLFLILLLIFYLHQLIESASLHSFLPESRPDPFTLQCRGSSITPRVRGNP